MRLYPLWTSSRYDVKFKKTLQTSFFDLSVRRVVKRILPIGRPIYSREGTSIRWSCVNTIDVRRVAKRVNRD